jgi:hypothetical protein
LLYWMGACNAICRVVGLVGVLSWSTAFSHVLQSFGLLDAVIESICSFLQLVDSLWLDDSSKCRCNLCLSNSWLFLPLITPIRVLPLFLTLLATHWPTVATFCITSACIHWQTLGECPWYNPCWQRWRG